MRIMYMGTPEFSAMALRALYDSKYGKDIVSVITQEDKAQNRGQKITFTQVKSAAIEMGINVYQPLNLKAENFEEILKNENPDLIVVCAYGKILPKYVLDYPKYGCLNIHTSILPLYRGAAPMQRAIQDGNEVLGVSIMKMDVGLDTGDIVSVSKKDFGTEKCFGEIHDELAVMGGELLIETIDKVVDGSATYTKQEGQTSYASKIEKEELKIDFSMDAKYIHNSVRAFSPSPCAFAMLCGTQIKILKTELTDIDSTNEPGTVTELGAKKDGYISVCAKDKVIKILKLIPMGKKEMTAGDFVRGRKVEVGQKFE